MSSMLNKIADAVTGHNSSDPAVAGSKNTTNATGSRSDLNQPSGAYPAGNQYGGVGPNYAGTNYSAANNGALKEGAQVRDTGLNRRTGVAGPATATATSGPATGTTAGLGTTGTGTTAGLGGVGTGTAADDSYLNENAMNDNAMTRSEEHLLVGKEKVNVGKAQLHKYVTSEKVSTAVPIIRERAVVEREPITDSNRDAALRGPDFKEAHYEVDLMEERAVAEKEEVPIERVRLRKETEQTQQYVEAELRKEHIELIDPTKNAGSGLGAGRTAGTTTGLPGRYAAEKTYDNTGTGLASDRRTATDATSGLGTGTSSSRTDRF